MQHRVGQVAHLLRNVLEVLLPVAVVFAAGAGAGNSGRDRLPPILLNVILVHVRWPRLGLRDVLAQPSLLPLLLSCLCPLIDQLLIGAFLGLTT